MGKRCSRLHRPDTAWSGAMRGMAFGKFQGWNCVVVHFHLSWLARVNRCDTAKAQTDAASLPVSCNSITSACTSLALAWVLDCVSTVCEAFSLCLGLLCCTACRVEYQGLAEQLLTAFQQANRAPGGPAGAARSRIASPALRSNSVDLRQADFEQLQFDHLGPTALRLPAATAVSAAPEPWQQNGRSNSSHGGSSSSSDTGSHCNSMDGSDGDSQTSFREQQAVHQQLQWQQHDNSTHHPSMQVSNNNRSSSSNGSAVGEASTTAAAAVSAGAATGQSPQPEEDCEAAAAAAADAAFMQLLLLLSQRASFVPLSVRDVALGVSLNTDFLWQLFVKVSTERLDGQLVAPDILGDAGLGPAAGMQQPQETEKLLVLRWVS